MRSIAALRRSSVDAGAPKPSLGVGDAGGASATSERPTSPATAMTINLEAVSLASPMSPTQHPHDPENMAPDVLAGLLTHGDGALLILDARPSLLHHQLHIAGSYPIIYPPLVAPRRGARLTPTGSSGLGSFGITSIASLFLSNAGRAAYRDRAGRLVVIVDDASSAAGTGVGPPPAARTLMADLAADGAVTGCAWLAGGFERFSRQFPHLCATSVPSAPASTTVSVEDVGTAALTSGLPGPTWSAESYNGGRTR